MAKVVRNATKMANAIELWPLTRLVPYDKNPRTHSEDQVAKIAASIAEFGFVNPILVDTDDGIIAGHGRLQAATKLGLDEVPVIVLDHLTPTQRRAYVIADNKLAELAGWDENLLQEELKALEAEAFDLELIGFGDEELQGLLEEPSTVQGKTDDDASPEPPVDPVTRPGDLWVLGKHRLLCGDSTSVDSLIRLFDGTVPDVAFSDPPYGIAIVKGNKVGGGGETKFGGVAGKFIESKNYAEIENDESTDAAREFYHACQSAGIKDCVLWGGNYFTDFLTPSACWLVWDKQNTGNFADVELAWTSFPNGAKLYKWLWNGMSRAGDRKTELGTRVHPTQKPVGLFELIFQDFDFKTCFDGFLGSGSTLIACEKTGRKCYGIELAPAYCDVILQRWADFTGKDPVHENGTKFSEMKSRKHPIAA
jgi:DNA modification methylase